MFWFVCVHLQHPPFISLRLETRQAVKQEEVKKILVLENVCRQIATGEEKLADVPAAPTEALTRRLSNGGPDVSELTHGLCVPFCPYNSCLYFNA